MTTGQSLAGVSPQELNHAGIVTLHFVSSLSLKSHLLFEVVLLSPFISCQNIYVYLYTHTYTHIKGIYLLAESMRNFVFTEWN